MPRVQEITGPIEHWLAGLDPDHEDDVDTLPQIVLAVRDWALELTAYPTAPQYRGQPTRLLAGGPVTVGSIDTVDKLRTTLDRKSRKYGEQSEPFVIAVLMPSTFANRNAVEKALFGDTGVKYVIGERGNERGVRVPNGFWLRACGPRAAHVSAVITGFGILPGETIATRWPRLWPNPHADRSVGDGLPLPRSAGSAQAQFVHDEERDPPTGLLGLEDGWPGPEPPFADDD